MLAPEALARLRSFSLKASAGLTTGSTTGSTTGADGNPASATGGFNWLPLGSPNVGSYGSRSIS